MRSLFARILAFFAAAVCLLLPLSHARAEETVRIAIVENASEIRLAGKGLEVRLLAEGERYAKAKGGTSTVSLKGGKMFLDGVRVDVPDGVKFRSESVVQVSGKHVRGQIEIRPTAKGKLIAINVLTLESYLHAVLGSEMPASFPPEALKAQAVAARTYALQKKIAAWGKAYHLGSTVLDQVYGGTQAEDPRTRVAVDATRGEVLIYDMELVEAYFHSSCGGKTENGKEALGRPLPYLKSVSCPCSSLPQTSWQKTFTQSQMEKLIPGFKSLRITSKTATGRVEKVQVKGKKSEKTLSGVDVRRILGYGDLKSLSFSFTQKGGNYTFSGKGFGHGAGLCQWGANRLAAQGKNYREILNHYYPGSEIIKMY